MAGCMFPAMKITNRVSALRVGCPAGIWEKAHKCVCLWVNVVQSHSMCMSVSGIACTGEFVLCLCSYFVVTGDISTEGQGNMWVGMKLNAA
jgi:hypothetical protein